MSDALFIAVGATGIAAVVLGVVTWMLILPARVARAAQVQTPTPAPPLERVDALLTAAPPDTAALQAACRQAAVDVTQLGVALADLAAPAQAGDAAARERRRRIAGVLRYALTTKRAESGPLSEAAGDASPPAVTLETLASLDEPPPPLDPARARPLSDAHWDRWVAAPSLDPRRSALAALVGAEVVRWRASPPEQFGLSRSQRAESLTNPPRLTRLAPAAARLLGVPAPVFYVAPERPERLIHVNLSVAGQLTPGVVVGGEALALEDNEPALWFMLGRKLAFLRPEHRLCTVVESAEEMRAIHLALAQILMPGSLPEAPDPLLGMPRSLALGKLRAYLGDAERAAAARRVLRDLATHGAEPDPAATAAWAEWLLASAETSFRSGLVLSGHLAAALRVLDLDGLVPGNQSAPSDCTHALLHFYLSDGFDRARHQITGSAQPDAPEAPQESGSR